MFEESPGKLRPLLGEPAHSGDETADDMLELFYDRQDYYLAALDMQKFESLRPYRRTTPSLEFFVQKLRNEQDQDEFRAWNELRQQNIQLGRNFNEEVQPDHEDDETNNNAEKQSLI